MQRSARGSTLLPALLTGAFAAALAAWCGCETNSTEQEIEIKPGSVTLSEGQSQVFTVSGGYEYAWSLDPDDGSAALNRRQGDTVTLTVLSGPSDESEGGLTIAVTCTSTIPGVSEAGTNGTSQAYSDSDTAYVYVR